MLGVRWYFLAIFLTTNFLVHAHASDLPKLGSLACRELVKQYVIEGDPLTERVPAYREGFTTPRYWVRSLEPFDFYYLRHMYSDPDFQRMERAPSYDIDWLMDWYAISAFHLESFGFQGNYLLAVHDYESNHIVALLQAYGLTAEWRINIGYGVLPGYWGKGIIGEVLPPFLEHLATHLNVQKFHAEVSQNNPRSHRLLEKNGFTFVGTQPTPGHPDEQDFIWEKAATP